MIKALALSVCCLITFACNSARPVAQNSNVVVPASSERPQTAIAHNTDLQAPPSSAPASNGTTSHWKQSGTPIDTKDLDSAVAAAEVALKKDPSTANKQKAADAYYKRAEALTKAQQYASALGDYRRTAKYDPSNTDAKEWIEKIIGIYDSMGREYPKEGEEPPALQKQ
jgi:tetratricopeptide (TPR) repeat protein